MVRVVLEDGRTGVGEVATSFAYPDETIGTIRQCLMKARAELEGLAIGEYRGWIGTFRAAFPGAVMTASGLEVALFRAFLSEAGISEHAYWGGKERSVETDITIPLLADGGLIAQWIESARKRGFVTYKLKVGGGSGQDRALLSTVYGSLKERLPGFRLRLDGNQGYTAREFLEFSKHVEKKRYEIELFEQPLKKDDFRGYEKIRGRSEMPIVLDESVIGIEDARRAIDNGLCDGINVKIAKSGIEGSRGIAELAKKNGMKLMAGCMVETMTGLSAGMFLALGRGDFDYIDLDSVQFLYGRNEYQGLRVEGPVISLGG